MKILTLTTYAGYNYGASLQAYALQFYLRGKGHDARVIRFEPEYLMRYYAFWYVNPESGLSRNALTRMVYRVAKWLQRRTTLKRKAAFDYFNHQLLYETKCYKSSRTLYENPPSADLFLVGSDQVWNVLYDAGKDPVFYLDFVREGKKASYAASFSYLDIPPEHFARIQQSLEMFDGLSVREYHGVDLLRKMGLKGEWVLDPIFLLNKEDWEVLLKRKDVLNNQYEEMAKDYYLLVYDFEGDERLKRFALEYAKYHRLKLYAITDRFPLRYADRNFKQAGPADFVRLIKGCSAFVSNSFHGTAFSILYQKPVFVFNRQRHRVNSRMESLLTLFELKDCLIEGEDSYGLLMKKEFDWRRVEDILEAMRLQSRNYLKSLGV